LLREIEGLRDQLHQEQEYGRQKDYTIKQLQEIILHFKMPQDERED